MIGIVSQASRPFVSVWKTDNAGVSSSTQITIPNSTSATINCTVDWGDGTISKITTYNDPAWTHTYSIAGTYTVKIFGIYRGIRFANSGDKLKILDLSQCGILKFPSGGVHFWGCSNMTFTALDTLDLQGATKLEGVFISTKIGACPALTWCNTSAITSMANAFNSSSNFSGDLSRWNVENVTDLGAAFFSTKINFSVAAWNTSKMTSMTSAFFRCSLFNQSFAGWDFSKVTSLRSFLRECAAYTQPINLNTSNLLTTLESFLEDSINYNSPVVLDDTSGVTSMVNAFDGASSFNQDVSDFSIASLTNASNMFTGSAFSETNYNLLLDNVAGWPSQATIQDNVTFSAGNAHYSGANAIAGRLYLTGTKSWTITDGGTP